MEVNDRRRFTRIQKQELPDFFKQLIAEIGDIKNIKAEALDATVEGIAIRISVQPTEIKLNDPVILHSTNNHFHFTGKVVNMAPLDNAHLRLGIQFF